MKSPTLISLQWGEKNILSIVIIKANQMKKTVIGITICHETFE
jgi:hypothetical protein